VIDAAEYLQATSDATDAAWNLPIDHWSPSSLAMLHRCPYQWQQRYLRGLKERPGEALTTGTAVHSGIERNFEQKIQTHDDLGLIELLDWYHDAGFPYACTDQQERSGMEIQWDTSFDQARKRGAVMLQEYHGGVSPRIQPLAVESEISVDFGLAVPIIGRFDVVRPHGVIDIKTGKAKQSKPKESWRIQAAVYSEATGKPVEFHSISAGVRRDGTTGSVSVTTPLEAEDLLVHPSKPEREELRRSLQTMSAVACLYMSIYGPDEDWPTLGRFHTWACDYCGYRSGCPAWRS